VERVAFARLLARNALLWIVPVAILWLVLTPLYNRYLVAAGESLLHLGESPDATRLYLRDQGVLRITRLDVGGGQSVLHETALSDFHFDWILLATLFLATPGVPMPRRLRALGWPALALLVFHLVLLVFYVESTYANSLGDWSARHYGALARNFWGLGKHTLNLPFKFALPFALWAASFWQSFAQPEEAPPAPRKPRRR
jgi:hypothetical protein